MGHRGLHDRLGAEPAGARLMGTDRLMRAICAGLVVVAVIWAVAGFARHDASVTGFAGLLLIVALWGGYEAHKAIKDYDERTRR